MIITVIDLLYVFLEFKEVVRKRTFRSMGVKIKYIFQEIAILIFLLALTIFGVGTGKAFR